MTRLLPVIAALVVLAAWGALSLALPPVLLPSPAEVAVAGWTHAAGLVEATLHTGAAALVGLLLASVVALVGAVGFLFSRSLELALYPYALLVQTLPIIAIAPLLVVWLGYGTPVAVASAAIVSFFPVLTSTHTGLRSAPPEQVELVRLYGASRAAEVWRLRLPAALPYLFTGLRTAGGLSVIGAIVGEFVGSNGVPPSLGFVVLKAARTADTAQSFAAIGCAAALALVFFVIVGAVERRTIGAWHPGGQR